MICYQKEISTAETKEVLERYNFHYVTSLIKSWVYGFRVTVKAFSSCGLPVCKQHSFQISLFKAIISN